MKVYAYASVSTDEQTLDVQEAALRAAGAEVIMAEKASGASREGRPKLAPAARRDRQGRYPGGDKTRSFGPVPHRRVGNRARDRRQGCSIQVGRGNLVRHLPPGRLMLAVFGGVAQFERERIRERQREGIDAAKKKGVYKGGTRRFSPDVIRAKARVRPAAVPNRERARVRAEDRLPSLAGLRIASATSNLAAPISLD
jgi:DNA invertase Pin-like site-specific DNA recombinase